MARKPFQRKDLKPGDSLCSHCTAKCCRYYALPIETPTTWTDFDHMRWYVMHGRTAVFVDDGTWYLLVYGDCEHLLPDHRCGFYEDRPQICRDYSSDNCEYDNDGCYDKYFESSAQVWEYAEAILPPRKAPNRKSAAGSAHLPQLPVIST